MANGKVGSEPLDAGRAVHGALHLDSSPLAIRSYYDQWASSYNADVALEGYEGPGFMASLLRTLLDDPRCEVDLGASGVQILDVCCGTGLIGVALRRLDALALGPSTGLSLDGLDISANMLAEARATGCYRHLYEANVDDIASRLSQRYDVAICCGGFTNGHLPPRALASLLEGVRDGGIVAVSTRVGYYDESGFADMIDELLRSGQARVIYRMFSAPYICGEDGNYLCLQRTNADAIES